MNRPIKHLPLWTLILSSLLSGGGRPAHAAGCSTPIFNVAPTYAVGRLPTSVASGDFNGDGITDLVTANNGSSSVSILLGDGRGGFGAPTNFAANADPYYVTVSDFNGDGKDDVAVVNVGTNEVSLLPGDGMGGLGAPTKTPVGRSPRAAVAGDFNGDNKLDLVVTNFSDNTISLLAGDGKGGFSPARNFSTGLTGGVMGITGGDFNGDGKPDVVVTIFDSLNVAVFLNDGAGGFVPIIIGSATYGGRAIASVDLDGDGKLDLVVGGDSRQVTTLVGNGSGGFVTRQITNILSRVSDVKTGDFNGDGKVDIFTANHIAGNVAVLLGDGQAGFAPPKYFGSGGTYPFALAPGDFNRDGKLDLGVINYVTNDLSVMLNDGQGKLAATPLLRGFSPRTVTVGDLNRDGRVDLITGDGIFLADGGGGFRQGAPLLFENVISEVATADFNGDGNLDIAATDYGNKVGIFSGDGAGGVARPLYYAAGLEPHNIVTADFNHDAVPDIVVSNYLSGTITVLLGNGAGGFAPPRSYPAGTGALDVSVADFNGDGQTDVVVTNTGLNRIAVLLGDGTGAFAAPVGYQVGQQPVAVTTADFNGDGKADVAATNSNNVVSVLLGNGRGAFSEATGFPVGFSPFAIATGDLNGDGKTDLVAANFNSLGVSVLLGDGHGAFAPAANFRTPGKPFFLAAADLNSDGKDDLAVVNDIVEGYGIALLFNTCKEPFLSLPTLSISNRSANEGDVDRAVANFTVSLSAPSDRVVTANYYTSDQSATAGADYQFASGRLTFAPGVTAQTISVAVNGDSLDEFDETFKLNIVDALNAAPDESRNVVTILDDDPLPKVSIGDAVIAEGDGSGTTSAAFTVSLFAPSAKPISVSYATTDGSAVGGSDYQPVGGILNFAPGDTTKIINVVVNGDNVFEPDETFSVTLSDNANVSIATAQGTGTILNDDAGLQFSQPSYRFSEGDARAALTVTRAGNTSHAVSINYRTVDTDTFDFGCADTVNNRGGAYARCDFATAVGVINFAAGDVEPKIITIPIIDDSYAEGSESFLVRLSNPQGATLSAPDTATITLQDNDATDGANPIFSSSFFVRQQYLDFLSREPDTGGFNAWLDVLNTCPNIFTGPKVASRCDRIYVSGEGFFRSQEFQLKGFYVFRFYKLAFNRLPEYLEVVTDMSFVAGATAEEVFARKAQLATLITGRAEFQTAYGGMTNAQYVAALLGRYGLTQVTTPDPANPDGAAKVTLTSIDLTHRLDANQLTRAQVLRAVADSDAVGAREVNNAFVAMQYYGYLRRKPDADGFNAWLGVLQSGDARTMVNGFLNSTEYKLRFGQP